MTRTAFRSTAVVQLCVRSCCNAAVAFGHGAALNSGFRAHCGHLSRRGHINESFEFAAPGHGVVPDDQVEGNLDAIRAAVPWSRVGLALPA